MDSSCCDDNVLNNKYRLGEQLGQGGMGIVYQAVHIELQKVFAVKFIRLEGDRQAESLARFRREAQVLGKLDHPNIVRVTDFGVDDRKDKAPYIVMEYLHGETMESLIKQGPSSWEVVHPILADIAQAIDCAHRQGIAHRDLKPANIMINWQNPGSPTVTVLDFGLARLLDLQSEARFAPADRPEIEPDRHGLSLLQALPAQDSDPGKTASTTSVISWTNGLEDCSPGRLTRAGSFLGTPHYMSPEAIEGRNESSSDIYALGLIVFELLTGRRPFVGNSVQVIQAHLCQTPPNMSDYLPGIPIAADDLVRQALAKNPDRRPTRAEEFIQHLDNAFQEEAFACRRKKRHLGNILFAMIFSLVCGAGCFWMDQSSFGRLLEGRAIDLVNTFRESHPMGKRIILTLIPETFWRLENEQDVDKFVRVAEMLLKAGVRGLVVDLLLPERFSGNGSFCRLVLENHQRLLFSKVILGNGLTKGMECINGLIAATLSPAEVNRLFCYVNVPEEVDGIVRRYRLQTSDSRGIVCNSLGKAAACLALSSAQRPSDFPTWQWLDPTTEWQANILAWEKIPEALAANPARFANALVFIGGFSDFHEDEYLISSIGNKLETVPGAAIHANVADGLIAGRVIKRIDSKYYWLLFAVWLALAVFSLLQTQKVTTATAMATLLLVGYALAALLFYYFFNILLPLALPLLSLILAIVSIYLFKRFFGRTTTSKAS